ncbi:MAG: hypothetical protein M9897_03645 [Brumimicrobium sp.]|nr:hypothetical protein [Brumimicrobium sp.]
MSEAVNVKPTLIEKELIPQLHFSKTVKIKQSETLMSKLMEATKLGNLHHGKVAVVFEDDEGLKRVETTVWATGLKYICLKGGIWLPIGRIHEVIIL